MKGTRLEQRQRVGENWCEETQNRGNPREKRGRGGWKGDKTVGREKKSPTLSYRTIGKEGETQGFLEACQEGKFWWRAIGRGKNLCGWIRDGKREGGLGQKRKGSRQGGCEKEKGGLVKSFKGFGGNTRCIRERAIKKGWGGATFFWEKKLLGKSSEEKISEKWH